MIVILLITSGLSSWITIPYIHNFLEEGSCKRKNYKGLSIPVGMGIAAIVVMLANIIFMLFLANLDQQIIAIFVLGSITMAFVGIIDDFMGNRNDLGLKGHMKALMKGRLTTGGLKAIVGGLAATIIAMFLENSITEIIINTIILTLSTNLFNLMDLRPGRCLKFFLCINIILLIVGTTIESAAIMYILIGFSIFYLKQDLLAKSMLGDCGSNLLGINIGIILALSYTLPIRIIVLIFLVILHAVAEKVSFTELIKRVSALRYLDELGRR